MKGAAMQNQTMIARRLSHAAAALRPLLPGMAASTDLEPVEAPDRHTCHRLRRTLRGLVSRSGPAAAREVIEVIARLRYAAVMLCMTPPNIEAAEESLEHAERAMEALQGTLGPSIWARLGLGWHEPARSR